MSRDEQNTLSWRMQALVVLLNLFVIVHVFGLVAMVIVFTAVAARGLGINPPTGFWPWLIEAAVLLLAFVTTVAIVARLTRTAYSLVVLVDVFLFFDLMSVCPKIENFVRPFLQRAIETTDDLPSLEAEPVVALVGLLSLFAIIWLQVRLHRALLIRLAGANQRPSIPLLNGNR